MQVPRIEQILLEINEIQAKPYQNWISAWSRKIKVNNLHKELDSLNYEGPRPPKTWVQNK